MRRSCRPNPTVRMDMRIWPERSSSWVASSRRPSIWRLQCGSIRATSPRQLTLAWLRATSPIDAVRDGGRALEFAQRLNSASGSENPMVLDVLAAAFAEQGDFDSALATMRNAVSVVGDRNSSVRQIFLARIKLYEAHQPLRDADGRYP